jgi:hypothetical protein
MRSHREVIHRGLDENRVTRSGEQSPEHVQPLRHATGDHYLVCRRRYGFLAGKTRAQLLDQAAGSLLGAIRKRPRSGCPQANSMIPGRRHSWTSGNIQAQLFFVTKAHRVIDQTDPRRAENIETRARQRAGERDRAATPG